VTTITILLLVLAVAKYGAVGRLRKRDYDRWCAAGKRRWLSAPSGERHVDLGEEFVVRRFVGVGDVDFPGERRRRQSGLPDVFGESRVGRAQRPVGTAVEP